MSSDRASSRLSPAEAIRGATIGVATFLVGFAVTYLTAAGSAQQAARAFEQLANAGGRFVPAWKAAGWTFLDSHFVGTTYPGGSVDMVGMASAQFLYLVPVLLCLLAGGVLATRSGARDPRSGMVAGMGVVFGYLPMAFVFAIILGHANVEPSLLRAIVVAGIVYPVAGGAIGGALTGVVRADS